MLFVLILFSGSRSLAQQVGIEMHTDVAQTDSASALETPQKPAISLEEMAKLYSSFPDSVYAQYLFMLLESGQYKTAEKEVQSQRSRDRQNLSLRIDLGDVYAYQRKYDKAKEQYDSLLQMLNGDDGLTQRIAKEFMDHGKDDYAIKVYERDRKSVV